MDGCWGLGGMGVESETLEGVSAGWEALEGVLGADGVEIGGIAAPVPTLSLSSPYSFHSSTSSRS